MTAKQDPVLRAEDAAASAERRAPFCVCGVPFAQLFVVSIVFAVDGWLIENLVRLLTKGILDCRFHLLPWIPVYALVPFAYCIVFGRPERIAVFGRPLFRRNGRREKLLSHLLCLLTICVAVFFGELVVGNLWDLLFGVQLWDYSALPLSVTRYAGLLPTLGYGIGAYAAFSGIYRPLTDYVAAKVPYGRAKTVSIVCGTLMAIDALAFVLFSAVHGQPPLYWSVAFALGA